MPMEITIAVPTHPVDSFEASYVHLPSEEGSMGVLQNHAPLRCVLDTGIVTCRLPDASERAFFVSGGLAMIADNKVLVLADTAEPAEDIDIERVRAAEERARKRLLDQTSDTDRARAEASLKRSLFRLKANQAAGR